MTTSGPSQPNLFDEPESPASPPSRGAFRARTLASLENELALKVRALVSGKSTGASFANYDPQSSSWKTSQDSFLSGSEPFSETWPRSGMIVSGTAYRLPPSAPRTGATGSGLLPTPRAEGHDAMGAGRHAKASLLIQSKLWPTPTASDSNGAGSRNTPGSKAHPGVSLTDAVRGDGGTGRLWPTPRASEWKGTGPVGSKSHAHRLKKGYLDATVLSFPTPTTQSAKGASNTDSRQGAPDLQTVVGGGLSGQPGGLSADWVEALMGFPIGWTYISEKK